MLNTNERSILRQLASEYADIAALPVHAQKREMWLKLNSLNMDRPMLLIDQIPWNEMDVDGSLVCQVKDPYWRGVEWDLRSTIYKWKHMPADMVFTPYICLPRPVGNTGWGIRTETSGHIILEKAQRHPAPHT